MIVGIDVDGVLANFFKAYEDLVVEVAGEDKFYEGRYPDNLPPVWNWPEYYGYSSEVVKEVWQEIKSSDSFWYNLEYLPGAIEFLGKLNQSGHEVYFITDRPGVSSKDQTTRWFINYAYPTVIISRKGKGILAQGLGLDVYIDDKPDNVKDVVEKSPSTYTFMPRYPYNQELHWINGSVGSLQEFAERAKLW